MKSNEIRLFREKLEQDQENLNIRRQFHEQYEWLEGYWNGRYRGNNHIDQFDREFGDYFWNLGELRDLVRDLASYPPIGSSKSNFDSTITIQRATYYLRFSTNLYEIEFPMDSDNDKEIANEWNKSAFNGSLTIVKQIRDNLFHGRKAELSEPQYTRNKELISMGVRITNLILEKLEDVENQKISIKKMKI
ncbi:hypothetical protein RM549_10950 [Salegentibacter sp. F188]|uniref:MAE-28990/MAE-18760-like HEPN domain-containing protein n=1 Tax=Autumnicola patrickiae TaxID=3075591 RepID=A0ABU3E2T6_9FLAO|nr:hypothetical protein [Salegentibacter sp. F188]MDT0690305.1 hypothetical protein [Salegentibacter sp. F188]